MDKKRKTADFFRYFSTSLSAALCLICLVGIVIYILVNGVGNLSWKLITNDYEEKLVTIKVPTPTSLFDDPKIENTYFSSKYGIALADGKATDGTNCIYINYIDENSPFKQATIKSTNEETKVELQTRVDVLMALTEDDLITIGSKEGAEEYARVLDASTSILSIQCKMSGGGIRGSLITTLILILLTLVIALPLGIGAAIYLVLYARDGKAKTIISQMIDMISGVPSIIFGFCGAVIFIPFVSLFGASGYSILAGALTMAIVLLPTIIKTTEEALMVVPKHYMMGSLALGASKTQTVFKVILPNALPGILTAILLSVGRIIGESAALIFVMGTAIKDNVSLIEGATTLSVHIWSITRGEIPNYDTACAISIIILIVVFVISTLVKVISGRLKKKMGV